MASLLRRLSETIAHELERRILDGALKPGDRLQPEREMAAELGVSRPSLREAIQKLVSKGLLHSRQGGGTYVIFSDAFPRTHVDRVSVLARLVEFYDAQHQRQRVVDVCRSSWRSTRPATPARSTSRAS